MNQLLVTCYINFPQFRGGPDPETTSVTFHEVAVPDALPPRYPNTIFHISEVTCLHESQRTFVFRATIPPNGSLSEPLDVVLKLDTFTPRADEFLEEAKRYEIEGQEIQGTSIPEFYGLFRTTWGKRTISCLVLQYCGEPLDCFFYELDEETRRIAAEQLLMLHKFGLQHNDLAERNVVIHPSGEPFFVDLGSARPHKCECKMKVVFGATEPAEMDFGCKEMFNFFLTEIGIWKPDAVRFMSRCVPICTLKDMESLLSLVPTYRMETEEDRRKAHRLAWEVLEDLGIEPMHRNIQNCILCPQHMEE